MHNNDRHIIMHVDVNSAYLAWEAVHALENGANFDYRTVPAVVGGDPKTRRGIVLAKSTPAKRYKISTGETLHAALNKCPNLLIIRPSYGLYMKCSGALQELLERYTPHVQRFSVDEFFVDFIGFERQYGDPVRFAQHLKGTINSELGFTVNIGVSTNKLLAKIAGDFEKPDKVHSLFPSEIASKLWPLPVGELYMVGRRTLPKLHDMGIYTIGDLAHADRDYIKYKLKKFGVMLQAFAHGIEDSAIHGEDTVPVKGIGNSTTIKFDVCQQEDAHMVLLSLTEMVSMRLRDIDCLASMVAVSIKSYDFSRLSHQRQLAFATDNTTTVYNIVKALFSEAWDGQPVRHLGVRVSGLIHNQAYQYSIFDYKFAEKRQRLDQTIDALRRRYGQASIMRGTFLDSGFAPIKGGTMNHIEYPSMKSQL